ncbi:tetratricopeptide repeat protein [Myxococcus sp. AM009]|uniref:tetratricopeptide repeat protein n=1 Tax=unclassified Myxococcus TaxID=2648731 RepID=UPI001594FD7E|nr:MULTISPECIES: tetratricopeptide repeat protein [unclassified Myxococcus]NVJ02395.1 tetratricopeptide repeat protein [Myxococcus sp. AM009]NVJ15034.1 tetratricopeptide repeat protein [Myxococcus sp. AM010]
MGCPSETTLSDFLEGALPDAHRTRVLAHVEGCERCQEHLALGASASEAVPPPVDGPLVIPGTQLSRYVVQERIGRGAMGEVYAAHDPELDRRLALKLLRPEGRHLEELRLRLLREAQALARLAHPHVVTVHDVGVCDDCVFLALELVEGASLAEWLESPRPWQDVVRVFVDAGRGLAAAHAAGLVHRDFKPGNVLVGKEGRVRVTDFGLARPSHRRVLGHAAPASLDAARAPTSWVDSPLTHSGALLGTPAYMAPEQLQGHGVDARSDQFSFCVALYEALHGVRPFEGRTLEALGQAAREGRIRAPERESKIPARVRRAVLRGLRARPEERFPTMEALLAELAPRTGRRLAWVGAAAVACALGLTVGYVAAHRRQAGCEREAERLTTIWGPERRERIHAAFLATGKPFAAAAWEAVARTLDGHADTWRALRTDACTASRDDANASWQTAACLDTRLWHLAAVVDVLEKADARTVQNAPQLVASLEGVSGCRDAPELVNRPQPPDALRPRVDAARRKLAEARAHMDAGNHPGALKETTALLQAIQGLEYRPLEAEVLTLHGYAHGLAGKPKEAEEHLYKALWAAEAGRDDETVARVWNLLLWVVGDQMARMDEANRLVHHARAAVERLGRERFPHIATDLHLRMGGLFLVQGKLDEADAEFTQGLELARRTAGPSRPRVTYFLTGLGRVRSRQLRAEEALALYREAQAYAFQERQWSPEHPVLALNLNNIATELLSLGRTQEALETFQRSLTLLEAARSKEHASLAAPLNNLAGLLRREGRLEEARSHYARALAIFERSKGPDHPSTVTALGGLGMVAYDSDRLDEALTHNQQALERIQRSVGQDSPRLEMSLRNLGLIHLRAGRPAVARRNLTQALSLLQKENGTDSVVACGVERDLARVDLETGAFRAALTRCQRALALDEAAQGDDSPDAALDLACLGEAHLGLRAPERAVPLLERARRIHARAWLDRKEAARVSFLLARALWERPAPDGREQATALIHEAKTWLEAQGLRARREHDELVAWQARHLPRVSKVTR